MTPEWVQVKATLHVLGDPRFDCSKCLNKYSNRTDFVEMTEKVRSTMFCRNTAKEPIHKIDDTLSFKTCVGNFYKSSVLGWLQAHRLFENGIMPFPGALMDQPNKVIELFNVFDEHKIERRREHERKMEELKRRKGG